MAWKQRIKLKYIQKWFSKRPCLQSSPGRWLCVAALVTQSSLSLESKPCYSGSRFPLCQSSCVLRCLVTDSVCENRQTSSITVGPSGAPKMRSAANCRHLSWRHDRAIKGLSCSGLCPAGDFNCSLVRGCRWRGEGPVLTSNWAKDLFIFSASVWLDGFCTFKKYIFSSLASLTSN